MESLGKQVGYLKGLLEGMGEEQKKELGGKLFSGIVEVLAVLSDRADTVDDMLSELNDYVESIDDDLTELENAGGDGDYDEDGFEDGEPGFGEDQLHLLKAEDSGDTPMAGGLCPECGGLFFIEGDDDALYVCPHCGKHVRVTPLTQENVPMGKPVKG